MTKEEFIQLCKTALEKQHGFVIIDLSSKRTMVNTEVALTSLINQIQLKRRKNVIFSFKNGGSS